MIKSNSVYSDSQEPLTGTVVLNPQTFRKFDTWGRDIHFFIAVCGNSKRNLIAIPDKNGYHSLVNVHRQYCAYEQ